jgi:hypothetical protein
MSQRFLGPTLQTEVGWPALRIVGHAPRNSFQRRKRISRRPCPSTVKGKLAAFDRDRDEREWQPAPFSDRFGWPYGCRPGISGLPLR